MSRFKVIIVIIVLLSGFAISYFSLRDAGVSFLLSSNESASGINLLGNDSLQWKEKLNQLIQDEARNPDYLEAAVSSDSLSANLTYLIAQSLFDKMKSLDQRGSNPFDAQNIDINSPASQQILQDTLTSIESQNNFFNQTISDNELKVSNDNSKEAKIIYLNKIKDTGENRFADSNVRSFDQFTADVVGECSGGNYSSVDLEVARAYQDLANDYLDVGVPSDWLNIHKEIITYFKNSSAVFSAIANCYQDPIKSFLAANRLSSLITEATKLWVSLANKYKEIGL